MAGAAQRDCAPRDASGGHSGSLRPRRIWPVCGDPDRGAIVWGGIDIRRRARRQRDRAWHRCIRARAEWRSDRAGALIGSASSRTAHYAYGPAPIARYLRRPFFVTSGGLISYAPETIDSYRRAAGYVDRILK